MSNEVPFEDRHFRNDKEMQDAAPVLAMQLEEATTKVAIELADLAADYLKIREVHGGQSATVILAKHLEKNATVGILANRLSVAIRLLAMATEARW